MGARRFFIIVFCILVLTPLAAVGATPALVREYRAAGITLTLRLDRRQCTVAEGLHLLLIAETAEDAVVRFPELVSPEAGWRVAAVRDREPEFAAPGRVRVARRYTIEPQLPGNYVLPPLTVRVATAGGSSRQSVRTDEIPFSVVSVLGKDGDKAALSGLKSVPVAGGARRPWVFAALAGAGVLIVALILFLRQRRGQKDKEPPPALSARQELDQLAADDDPRRVVAGIDAVLRRYLAAVRPDLGAMEQTSAELAAALDGARFPADQALRARLCAFFQEADAVKFASRLPDPQQRAAAHDLARAVIAAGEEGA